MRNLKAYLIGFSAGLLTLAIMPSCKEERGPLKRIWYNGSYNRDFNDLNDVQLAMAKKIGIKPATTREYALDVKH